MSFDELLSKLREYIRKARSLEDSDPGEAANYYREAAKLALKLAKITENRDVRARLVNIAEKLVDKIKAIEKGEAVGGEAVSPESFILVEKPNVKWSDVADLEEAKKALLEAVIASLRPDLFPLGGWRGILLYGPPGTGKTLLAKAVATELNLTFIYVSIPQVLSKWFGESEKNIHRIFEVARKNQPSIIFFDEIDAINTIRAEDSSVVIRIARTLQIELDGLTTRKTDKIIVLAATNHPWDLDPAILQRFERRIYVPLPDKNARKKIFEIHLRGLRLDPSVDLDKLAELTKGYSGREIVQIIKYVQLNKIEKYLDVNNLDKIKEFLKGKITLEPITMNDFIEAIKKIKPIKIDQRKYIEWSKMH